VRCATRHHCRSAASEYRSVLGSVAFSTSSSSEVPNQHRDHCDQIELSNESLESRRHPSNVFTGGQISEPYCGESRETEIEVVRQQAIDARSKERPCIDLRHDTVRESKEKPDEKVTSS
jgi:hypothetical protein